MLVLGAPKGDVDDIGRRGKRREVGDGVLGDLNDALLHFVGEFFARAQFFVGGEVDIDFAAGEVLHILLKVQLHHRIGARRPQRVGGGESQGIFGVFFAPRLFLGGLGFGRRSHGQRCGRPRPAQHCALQKPPPSGLANRPAPACIAVVKSGAINC